MQANNDSIAYLNGEYRELGQCTVPINLHALQYGTGCFEGIRGYWDDTQGQLNLLFLREHFTRLHRNALMLRMDSPGVEQMCAISEELIRRNKVDYNVYIRPMVYINSTHLGPRLCNLPVGYLCYIQPLDNYIDTANGLDVCVSSWARLADNMIPTRAKATGAYLNSSLAKTEAESNGYDEAILLNTRGLVSEGSAENIFLVRDGILVTPAKTEDILEGITRQAVINLAGEMGIPVEERPVARTELYRSDEAFLVGTGCQISWIKSIDRRELGDGTIGPITERIQKAYEAAVYGRDATHASWLTAVK